MTAEDIAIITGASKDGIERALQVLTGESVGWIDAMDSNELDSKSNEVSLQDSTGQDKTKDASASTAELGRNGQPAALEPSEFVFPTTGQGPQEWTLPQAKLTEYVKAYPALDVPGEMRKARQWCRDNARNRKTARRMQAFLTGWLNRVQNRGGRVGDTRSSSPPRPAPKIEPLTNEERVATRDVWLKERKP